MTSDLKIQSNRENAKKSTGPKTKEGKERSKMNACKTGRYARTILLPDEDPTKFDVLRKGLLDEWAPQGYMENHYVQRLTHAMWKIDRLERGEPELWELLKTTEKGSGGVGMAYHRDARGDESLSKIQKAIAALAKEISLASESLARLQSRRQNRSAP